LLIDSDPQGSIAVTLRLKPEAYLADFILNQLRLPDCIVNVADRLEVLCGYRETTAMEQRIFTMYGRELVFQKAFGMYEESYDAIVVDVAPSISLLQACSMVFCQNVLIPISMDTLSVSGAGATIFSGRMGDACGQRASVFAPPPTSDPSRRGSHGDARRECPSGEIAILVVPARRVPFPSSAVGRPEWPGG
jgi:cellulose biosynthesis protein BcsQ